MVFQKRKQDSKPSPNSSILCKNNVGSDSKGSRKSTGLKSIVEFMMVQKQISIKDLRMGQRQRQRQQQLISKQLPNTIESIDTDGSNSRSKESLGWHFMHSILNNDKLFLRCLALIFVIFLITYILINQLLQLLEKLLDSLVTIGKWYSLGNISNSIFNGSIFRLSR